MSKVKYRIDVTGQKFNRLTALRKAYVNERNQNVWECRCDCGNITFVPTQSLVTGNTKSCGCLQKAKAARIGDRSRTHGDFGTPLYRIWAAMKRRCLNPNTKYYKDYGGRGIKVCSEWLEYSNFKEWSLSHGYEDNKRLSVERIDVNGNYEPSNCCWIPLKNQGRNTRRSRHIIYKGKSYALSEVAEITGISMRTIQGRYDRGWSPEQIFETPLRKNQYK